MAPATARAVAGCIMAASGYRVVSASAKPTSATAHPFATVGDGRRPGSKMSACPLACSGRGTCDLNRGTCSCPIGFDGAGCEHASLPECMLGSHLIPIRSWVLHALEREAGKSRWAGAPRAIGPVPCGCLRALIETPFFFRRTELGWVREHTVRCLHVENITAALVEPAAVAKLWRAFSFEVADETLRMSARLAFDGAPDSLPDSVRGPATARAGRRLWRRFPVLRPVPAVLRGPAPALPLLPLAACGGCSGRGWCEPAESSPSQQPHARCGCFVPGGLSAGVGGRHCEDARVWTSSRQPDPSWGGPYCPADCSGRGECDWMGFCRCEEGWFGLDCALHLDATSRQPMVSASPTRQGRARGSGRRRRSRQRDPSIYIADLPPLLRFGNVFMPHFEEKLFATLRASSHRSADPRTADYVYVPGPPLVIDGHRLLARLWYVREHHPWQWNLHAAAANATASLAAGGGASGARADAGAVRGGADAMGAAHAARVMLVLATERASMDTLQLSANPADREEWPALAEAPSVRGLRALTPSCDAWARRRRQGLASDGATGGGGGGSALVRQLVELETTRDAELLRSYFGHVRRVGWTRRAPADWRIARHAKPRLRARAHVWHRGATRNRTNAVSCRRTLRRRRRIGGGWGCSSMATQWHQSTTNVAKMWCCRSSCCKETAEATPTNRAATRCSTPRPTHPPSALPTLASTTRVACSYGLVAAPTRAQHAHSSLRCTSAR